jgi:hypothetical protein
MDNTSKLNLNQKCRMCGIVYHYYGFTAIIHHSYGRMLRNEFGLWNKNSPIVRWFKKKYGITHADDISTLIIIGLIFLENHDIRERIMKNESESFKEHWSTYR